MYFVCLILPFIFNCYFSIESSELALSQPTIIESVLNELNENMIYSEEHVENLLELRTTTPAFNDVIINDKKCLEFFEKYAWKSNNRRALVDYFIWGSKNCNYGLFEDKIFNFISNDKFTNQTCSKILNKKIWHFLGLDIAFPPHYDPYEGTNSGPLFNFLGSMFLKVPVFGFQLCDKIEKLYVSLNTVYPVNFLKYLNFFIANKYVQENPLLKKIVTKLYFKKAICIESPLWEEFIKSLEIDYFNQYGINPYFSTPLGIIDFDHQIIKGTMYKELQWKLHVLKVNPKIESGKHFPFDCVVYIEVPKFQDYNFFENIDKLKLQKYIQHLLIDLKEIINFDESIYITFKNKLCWIYEIDQELHNHFNNLKIYDPLD